MLALVVVGVVTVVALVSIGLTLVEYRRISTPLVFKCQRCGAQFQQAPHRAYPRACPACHAANWAS